MTRVAPARLDRPAPIALTVLLVFVLGLAGCAPSAPPPSHTALPPSQALPKHPSVIVEDAPDFNTKAALETLSVAFERIAERYIDPLHADRVALGGLAGIAQLDPALAINRDGPFVMVSRTGRTPKRFLSPPSDDALGWAATTLSVFEFAQQTSAPLQRLDNEAFYSAVFKSALAGLDSFSRYASAEEARRMRSKREGYGGIGVRFRMDGNHALVTKVHELSPAESKGLRIDDRITHIDDRPVKGLGARDVSRLLRGPIDSHLTLSFQRDRIHRTAILKRAHVIPSTVDVEVEDGIVHVRISGFNQRTSKSLALKLRDLGTQRADTGFKGLLLDVRGNPGGLLRQAVKVADLFMTHGVIVSTRGRHPDTRRTYRASGADIVRGLPIAVLIDGMTASAAEILAAALQDADRAVVIGTNSYGKGTVQNVVRLPNDGEVVLTWSRFHAPTGYALQELGVLPTICSTKTFPDIPRPTETQLIESAFLHSQATVDIARSWRQTTLQQARKRLNLRHVCPSEPRRGGGDRENAIAHRLLSKPILFDRALALMSVPEIQTATTPEQNP